MEVDVLRSQFESSTLHSKLQSIRKSRWSVRFYMDVHVSLAITERLRMREVDVLTAQADGATRLEDSLLLDRATELG
jgi:Domain of unknown function (DUF5615)